MSRDPEIRPAESAEALQEAMAEGFGFDWTADHVTHLARTLELERTRCVFDGAQMVGTCGAYSLRLTVPGGSLPTGGTTFITVRATHRRQGLLRAMMRAHLDDVREREEPLAVLWASESGIYGRFGYGSAALAYSGRIERAHGAFARPVEAPGRLRQIDVEEARKLLAPIYERVLPERPGHIARSEAWWESHLADPAWERDGASKFRYVLYEEAGEPRGFLQYRIQTRWHDSGVPNHILSVVELQSVDAVARAALWRYALDVDLVGTVIAWNLPADDSLPWLLADARRYRPSWRDGLWLRLMDVPVALEGRRWETEGRIVFALRDELCPWNEGTWELEAGPDGARCRPSQAEPELRLGAEELGTVYLGGDRFAALAGAGRIEGSTDAIRRADRLFRWHCAPWCPEVF